MHSPQLEHPWVLISWPRAAPTLQVPAAESQRSHQEITLRGVMDLGHGSRQESSSPAHNIASSPEKRADPGSEKPSTHGRGAPKRAICAEPGCGYQGMPRPSCGSACRGSCSPGCLTPLVHSCRDTGANTRTCKFGDLFCLAAGCCSLLASPKCCLETELGCYLLNAPRSGILPLPVAAGQPSGALHQLLGEVCVQPQPAGLLICPNATCLG